LAPISVFAFALLGGGDLRAAPNASLEVVWIDPYNLSPLGFEPVRREVGRLLEQIGVEAFWSVDPVGSDEPPGSNEVRIFLTKSNSKSWGLKCNALGTVLGEPRRYVYVFVPNLMAALKVARLEDLDRSPGRMNEFARAMGRVIVHEMGHVFNPGRPHTDGGLMSLVMTQAILRKTNLTLDRESAEYIGRPMLAALAPSSQGAVPVVASTFPN
jgi:hypothetical protein